MTLEGIESLNGDETQRESAMRGPDMLGRRNRALQAVPPLDWPRFLGRLQRSALVVGRPLKMGPPTARRVYFPESGAVSVVVEDPNHQGIEINLVGREGTVGALMTLSGQHSFIIRPQVQIPGTALWMEAETLHQEFQRGGAFALWLLRYFGYMSVHMGQCSLCNRLHSTEERLARWLLTLSDRLDSSQFHLTHEGIGQMVGTPRSGVTLVLGTFQRAGYLTVSRGSIHLLNRAGLEATACDCYQVLRRGFVSLWEE